MFYRIKDNNLFDYADYKYAEDCLETNLCTMDECNSNPEKYLIATVEDEEQQAVQKLVINPEWENIQKQKRETSFKQQFFETSLGWIRRKVTMKDGSKKDFLGDLLLPIKTGLDLGQSVSIITYKTPDYDEEFTNEYFESLQEIKQATPDFIQECLFQTVKDFGI